MSDSPQEPKIVVDEDWKSKVDAEKRAAAAAEPHCERPAPKPTPERGSTGHAPSPPFALLVSTLTAQAMTAMGKVPDPHAGHAVVRPDVAKHLIDMLAMLEEKTKGNLTAVESEMLSDVLHELRMLFVAARIQPEAAP